MATKKRSRHPAVAAASDRPGPSGARVAFEDDAEENGDADEEGEEGELLEPLHGREEEEDEGAHGSATGYYSSHRRRKSTRLKSKLADLPGGGTAPDQKHTNQTGDDPHARSARRA